MKAVCFYFQVHQPRRIRKFRHIDIGETPDYFNDSSDTNRNNEKIMKKVAQKCYLPTNRVLLSLLNKHPEFRVSFSLSGLAMDQMEEYTPEVIESFQELVATGRVEILAETYYHSLSFLYSTEEYKKQVALHRQKVKKLFKVTPTVFRNTELIYNDELGKLIEEMGYKAVLTEGADHILGWQSPQYLYHAAGTKNLKLLLKNYRLSDDIAFRFGNQGWNEYPLTSEKFAHWVSETQGDIVNLFMDYETFGEHQWEDTGIFSFLESLPEALLNQGIQFVTCSEALKIFEVKGELSIQEYISWADVERDLSAWRSNDMQKDALAKLFGLEQQVKATKNKQLVDDWRRLTTSDHFYYMCTKWFNDGDVHKYFNPYESPYEAFRYFMNVLTDISLRIPKKGSA